MKAIQTSRLALCLAALEPAGGWDTEEPFAHGPGERGGWLIRFSSLEPASTKTVEFEITNDGECHRRP